MGNIVATIKRFLSNKNTVTIIGVLLGIIVLYVGYNYRVKSAVSIVSVPRAKKNIDATTQITSDMLTTTEVLSSMVAGKNNTIIRSTASLVNNQEPYCVAIGTSIPAGGFFHTNQVVKCGTIAKNVFDSMPDGYKPVSLSVDIHKTFGNSMYPGDYIDLYARMTIDGKLVYGPLVSKLPIMDVRDSSGNSVFLTSKIGTPAELLFSVPNDPDGENYYQLLSQAILLGESKVELIPVPGNREYTTTVGETRVTSQFLKNKILEYTLEVPDIE